MPSPKAEVIDPADIPSENYIPPENRAVTSESKPSDALKPSGEIVHVLADGRTVALKKYPRSLTLLVTRALGENSLNPMLTAYYRCVAWVRSVDGVVMPKLESARDFDWVIEQLGDDALEEIADVVWAQQASAQLTRQALGNSSTTPSGEK